MDIAVIKFRVFLSILFIFVHHTVLNAQPNNLRKYFLNFFQRETIPQNLPGIKDPLILNIPMQFGKIHGEYKESHQKSNYPDHIFIKPYTQETYETSCGEATCQDMNDYPLDTIRAVFKETYKNKEFPRPEEGSNELSIASIFDLHNWQSFRTPDCEHQVEWTYPKEAINRSNRAVLLVSIPEYHLKCLLCKSPRYCRNHRTPLGKIYFCKSKLKWTTAVVFDKIANSTFEQKVKCPDGCECSYIRNTSEF